MPTQTLANSPGLNLGLTSAQIGARVNLGPQAALNAPGEGRSGKVYVSKEFSESTGSNALNAIYGSYAHELGNILDAKINPSGTRTRPYQNVYGDKDDPTDKDTGAAVERCIFGALQGPDGPY